MPPLVSRTIETKNSTDGSSSCRKSAVTSLMRRNAQSERASPHAQQTGHWGLRQLQQQRRQFPRPRLWPSRLPLPLWLLLLLLQAELTPFGASQFPPIPPPLCAVKMPTCLSDGENEQCDCHRSCRFFGSCCENANSTQESDGARPTERLARDLYECASFPMTQRPLYIVTKCPTIWFSPVADTRSKRWAVLCNSTDLHSFRNNFDARYWPVTSAVTGLTYKSVYCALCHGETSHAVEIWSAGISCPNMFTPTDDRERLRLCSVAGFRPPSDRELAPRCWHDMIDHCLQPPAAPTARTADDTEIGDDEAFSTPSTLKSPLAEECHTKPQLTVWWKNVPYRNRFCAECLGAAPHSLRCSPERHALTPVTIVGMQSLLDPAGPLCRGCRLPAAGSQQPQQVEQDGEPLQRPCRGGEFYDWLSGTCRSFCSVSEHSLPDGGVACAEDEDHVAVAAALPVDSTPSELLRSTPQLGLSQEMMFTPGAQPLDAVQAMRPPLSPLPAHHTVNVRQFDRRTCNWQSYEKTRAELLPNNSAPPVQSGVFELNASITVHGVESSQILYVVFKKHAHDTSRPSYPQLLSSPGESGQPVGKADGSDSTLTKCSLCRWQRLAESEMTTGYATGAAVAGGVYWRQHLYASPLVRLFESSTILVCADAANMESLSSHFRGSSTHNQTRDGGGNSSSRCSETMDTVAAALMGTSIFCLVVHAIAFCFVPSLRNLPGRVVFAQVMALLLAYSLNFSRVLAADGTDAAPAAAVATATATACRALAVAVHYFLLAYFVWTLVLAVEIHGAVRGLKQDSSGSAPRFIAYSIAGWLLPLGIVTASLATDHFGPPSLRPGYGPPQCWMSNTYGFVLFFLAPLCTIVLADVALYVAIVVRLVTRERGIVAPAPAAPSPRCRSDRDHVVLCVKLLLALGLMWTFAVAGALSGNDIVLCAFSNVLNASQGVFIFVVFFCSHRGVQKFAGKVLRRQVSRRLQRWSRRRPLAPSQPDAAAVSATVAASAVGRLAGSCRDRERGGGRRDSITSAVPASSAAVAVSDSTVSCSGDLAEDGAISSN